MSDRYQLGRVLQLNETDSHVIVAEAEDADDWVVRFEKSSTFPALLWANTMIDIFNTSSARGRGPLGPELNGAASD